MEIRKALANAAEKIFPKWSDTPFLDASVLLQKAIGISKEKLIASYSMEVSSEALASFENMVAKRISGWPVSYIINEKEFFGLPFYVDERVLVPRSDTEILVEKVIETAKKLSIYRDKEKIKILDLCTGSGCIAISLDHEIGNIANLYASDISSGAFEVFSRNSISILSKELPFIKSNLLESIKDKFDIIVSNPPYLTVLEVDEMKEKNWPEPVIALKGGLDGLDLIKQIVQNSWHNLTTEGLLAIEADPNQMEAIEKLLTENSYKGIEITKDLANQNRVISGWLKN